MKPRSTLRSFLAIAGSSLLAISSSASAGQIWDGTGANTNWDTLANWDGDALPDFTSAITFAGTVRPTNVNNLAADTTIGGINFTNTAGTFSISGNRITLGGNIVTTATGVGMTDTISLAMILNGNRTITTNTLHNLTLSGIISGTGTHSLIKDGAGDLILNTGNTFSGGFTLNSGRVVGINAGTYGGFGSGTLTVTGGTIGASNSSAVTIDNALNWGGSLLIVRSGGSGGTPTFTFTNTLTLTSNFALNLGASTTAGAAAFTNNISGDFAINVVSGGPSAVSNALTLSGANNTFSGGLSLTGGSRGMFLNINSATALGATAGTFTIGSSGVVIDNTSAAAITLTNNNPLAINANFTFTGTRDLNMGTGAVNLNGAAPRTITTTAGTLTLGGVISNGGLTKAGNGTLALTGTNIFANGTTVSGGTLMLGDGTANTGNLGGTAAIAVALNATLAVNRTGATTQFTDMNAKLITGAGSFLQAGSGTTTLGYLNTYTGTTTISNGTLSISNIDNISAVSSHIGAPTTAANGVIMIGSVGNTGTLAYTGTGHSSDRQIRIGTNSTAPVVGDTGGATITANGASNAALSFSATTFNTQTDATTGVGADRVLTLQGTSTGANTISGIIQDNLVSGSGTGTAKVGVTKAQAGTWILSGTNTYTGATNVTAGTLVINGSTSSTSLVTVGVNGTLGGTGTVGGATTISGTHSPGNSPGIQTFGSNLTYSGVSPSPVVNWELANNTTTVGVNPTANFDQVIVGGNLDFTDITTINLSFNGASSTVLWANVLWDANQSWLLYDVAGTTSNFGNLNLATINWLDSGGNLFSTTGGSFSLGQSGQDVVLNYTVVPEPRAALLGGLGLLALLRRRRA